MNQIYVWVKYGDSDAVKINASACEDVDGLKDLVKQRLSPKLDSVAIDDITICSSAPAPDGTVVVTTLRPGLSISSLTPNDDEHPFFVRVTPLPAGRRDFGQSDAYLAGNTTTSPHIVEVDSPDVTTQTSAVIQVGKRK